MSEKKSLFYDPENRFLWVQDGDKRVPLYTLANLNHETTRLTDDGYLLVKDSVTGVWNTVKDSVGKVLSLKGKDGVNGKDGLDGTVDEERLKQMLDDLLAAALEYHLELSNDADLIYVGDTTSCEVSIYQQLSTSVTLYQGGVLCPIDGTRWKLKVNTKDLPGLVAVSDNEVVTFTFPTGTKIPYDRFVYLISAILYDKNGNVLKEIIKDFKVVRLAGNVDYDLAVTPGYIKMDSNRYLTTEKVTVKIRKKEIGLNGNALFIAPGQLPQHLHCYYKWNQDSKLRVPYDGIISLPTDNSKQSSDQIIISLENSTTTIDEAYLEIVQDGTNGRSPGHIELSDDFSQLSAQDNLVEVTLRFPLEIQYYIGTEPQELSAHNILFPSSSLYSIENIKNKTTSCVSAEVVVYAGTRILPAQLKVPISIGEVTKHFTLTKTSNTTLYSLITTPGLVKAIQDTTQSQLTWMLSDSSVGIEIYERLIGLESTSSKKTTSLPYGYKLEWFVDGEELGQVAYSNGKASVLVPQPIDGVLAGKITLRLYDQYQELVDFSEVAIQANGEKGEKGDPSVLIDLTNDLDLLHITPEGKILSTEPLTTDVHVFKGTKQLEIDEYTIDVKSEPDIYTAVVKDSTVTVQFNPEANIDPGLSQYLIPIKVTRKEEQDTFTKNFRLVVRQDNESFDFKCSPSALVLSKTNVLTPDHVEVVVSKTVYGATTTVERGVNWELSGYRLYYTVDDDASEYTISPLTTSDGTYVGQVLSSEIKKNSTTDRPKAHFYLDDSNGVNVDHEVINSLLDGTDGTNAETYVIDFSNDFDLIYIDLNNNLYENLIVTTEVKLFDGTSLLVPETGYRLEIQLDSSLDDVLPTFDATISNSYLLTFNFSGVRSIPVGMNSVNFTINIKHPLGDEIILSKMYKVSVIKDSTDYDLIPSSTRVRIKLDGKLDIPSVSFSVKKRSLGSNNQLSGTVEDLASEGLVLKYTIGNSPSTANTELSGTLMPTTIPSGVNTKLPISARVDLYKGSELRDFVIIDYLKDGEKGDKGDDGKTPVIISLSNDMDNINTINGAVISSEVMTTEVYIYEGLSKLPIAGKGWSCSAKDDQGKNFSNITITANSDHFAIAKTFNVNEQASNINLTLSHNTYGTYTKTFNIAAVEGRYDYDLIVSPSVLSYDGNGNLTTSTINVSVRKRIVGAPNATPELLTALPEGLTLASLPNITSLALGDNSISSITGLKTYSASTKLLELYLKKGNTVIDKCVLEKIKGGTNGHSAFTSLVFLRNNSTPSTPTGGSFLDPKPSTGGWSDGVPSGDGKLWMSKRVFTSDGQAPQTAVWTDPVVVSTSAGFEVQFSSVDPSPGTPSSNAGNWSTAASTSTVWMATRKQTNGTWGSWTVVKIKGETGDPGNNGAPAKQLVCTSGNEHTFYLNPQGTALGKTQVWTPTFALLEGSTQTNVTIDFPSCCTESTGKLSLSSNGISITKSGSYEEKTYVITVTYTGSKDSYSCTLYATCVKGSMSYDLKCSPGYIKKSAAGDYSPIEFSVYSECSGGGYSEEVQTSFNSALTLWYSSTSGNDTLITKVTTSGTINFTPTDDTMTFKLKSGSTLLDFETLTVVKDGAPGTLEANIMNILDSSGGVIAGMDGTASGTSFLWAGGARPTSSNFSDLAVAFAKSGVGSKFGPIEVLGPESVAINSADKKTRLVFTSSQGEAAISGYTRSSTSANYSEAFSIGTGALAATQTVSGSFLKNVSASKTRALLNTAAGKLLTGTSTLTVSGISTGVTCSVPQYTSYFTYKMKTTATSNPNKLHIASGKVVLYVGSTAAAEVSLAANSADTAKYSASETKLTDGSRQYSFTLPLPTIGSAVTGLSYSLAVEGIQVYENNSNTKITPHVNSNNTYEKMSFSITNVPAISVTASKSTENGVRIGSDGFQVSKGGTSFAIKTSGNKMSIKPSGLPAHSSASTGELCTYTASDNKVYLCIK